ncbi:15170_t:CDS:2, partial [Dentiscutata heterogama]
MEILIQPQPQNVQHLMPNKSTEEPIISIQLSEEPIQLNLTPLLSPVTPPLNSNETLPLSSKVTSPLNSNVTPPLSSNVTTPLSSNVTTPLNSNVTTPLNFENSISEKSDSIISRAKLHESVKSSKNYGPYFRGDLRLSKNFKDDCECQCYHWYYDKPIRKTSEYFSVEEFEVYQVLGGSSAKVKEAL